MHCDYSNINNIHDQVGWQIKSTNPCSYHLPPTHTWMQSVTITMLVQFLNDINQVTYYVYKKHELSQNWNYILRNYAFSGHGDSAFPAASSILTCTDYPEAEAQNKVTYLLLTSSHGDFIIPLGKYVFCCLIPQSSVHWKDRKEMNQQRAQLFWKS